MIKVSEGGYGSHSFRYMQPRFLVKKDMETQPVNSSPGNSINKGTNNWQTLYILTEHWQSDLIFFKDELRFFRSLIDKHFLSLIDEKNIDKTRLLVNALSNLENQRAALQRNVKEHLKHLGNLLENPFPYNAQHYRAEHTRLEVVVAEYFKNFRQTKKEIFAFVEQVMESEKAKHLLPRNN